MAYSIKRYVGDGVNKNFALTFPYIAKTDIHVYVDGVEVSFTWFSDTVVTTTVAPGAGTVVSVERQTTRDSALVDFQDATVLKEASLDLNTTQLLYIAQEAFDYNEESLSLDLTGLWDALNKRIINVADPVDDQDAATKAYVVSFTAASVAAAAASAAAAAVSETNAAASAAAALTSEINASTSETNAAGSESGAASSASSAASSASAASASETKAHQWAEEAEDVEVDPGEYSAHHWATKAMATVGGNQLTIGTGGTPPSTYKLELWDNSTNNVHLRFSNLDTLAGGFRVGIDNSEVAQLWNYENTDISFGTNSAEVVRFMASGNVKIGAAGDNFKINIHESSSSNSQIQFTNDTTGITATDGTRIGLTSAEAFDIWNYESTYIRFATNNSEAMRITELGQIAMGVTSANYNIQVHQPDSGYSALQFTNLTTATGITSGMLYGINSAEQGLVWNHENTDTLFGTNNTERMRIHANGKVSLGTAAANYSLTVQSNAADSYIQFMSSTSGETSNDGLLVGLTNDGGSSVWLRESGYLKFGTNNTERMRIAPDGKVMIGSSTSNHQAVNVYSAGSTNAYVRFQNGATGQLSTDGCDFGINTVGQATIWNREAQDTVFGTNGSERMRIDANGKIAFGGSSAPTNQEVNIYGSASGQIWLGNANTGTGGTVGGVIGVHTNGQLRILQRTAGEDINLASDTVGSILLCTDEGDIYAYEGGSARLIWDYSTPSGFVQAAMPVAVGAKISTGTFTAHTAITAATFESVGPTGSGATNIWSTLDNVPTDARFLDLKVDTAISGSTNGNQYAMYGYARKGGSTDAANINTRVMAISFINRSGSNEETKNHTSFRVPIDTSLRFEYRWDYVGTSPTNSHYLALVGWA